MKITLAFILLIFTQSSLSLKVLGILPSPGLSHFYIGSSILESIHNVGHEISIISPFSKNETGKDFYREFTFENLAKKFQSDKSVWKTDSEPFQTVITLFLRGVIAFEHLINSFQVQELMNSGEKFDVCLIEIFARDALLGLVDHFGCELISFTTFGAVRWIDDMTGNQSPASYIPHPFSSNTEVMNFRERFYNTALTIFEYLAFNLYHIPKQRRLYEKYFPNAKKSFDEMFKNSGVIFLNTHVSISSARPYLPSVVEIGGIHVKKAKKLPENIQKFLDSASDGAIVFTMGSFIKSQDFPEKTRETLVKVFGKLKQKVIWKYENETLPNKPDNVMISPWIPQRDILAHPNIKLFITHGGLLGTSEAIVEAVPTLGFPIFGDQRMNMAKAIARGYGASIPFDEIKEEILNETLKELLNNPKYKNSAKEISAKFNDRPMTPQEAVVYWTEYVVKHKGASHLRAVSRNFNFIELNLIDVYLAMLGILVVILWIDFLILRFLFRKCCKKSGKKQKRN